MECSAEKAKINETSGLVRTASFKEKERLSVQQLVDKLLDSILDFKQILRIKINEIENHQEKLEEISWFDNAVFDEETKKTINDVISITRDWIDSLRKNHSICAERLNIIPLSIEEMEEYTNAIEDLNESNNDLERAIFFRPNDVEFNSITEALKRID